MRTNPSSQRLLAVVVLGHLIVNLVHGAAHSGARIPMTLAANLFIWIVILAGPIVGWWVSRSRPVAGAWIVAAAMAASLMFGVVNHFVIVSPDHVNHVAAEWRTLFAITAVLLLLFEAAGVVAGTTSARRAARGFSESSGGRASRFDSPAKLRSPRS
jgi:hypothetical protein